MQKKIELNDLDIPKDDIECWDKYPKFRWVYEITRLLDSQNIKWLPFKVQDLSEVPQMDLYSESQLDISPGKIYVQKHDSREIITEAYIIKGEIKLLRHVDRQGNENLNIEGGIELRVNAFVSLYFSKFTGVLSFSTFAEEIFSVKLRPISLQSENAEILKLLKRIYKKSDSTVNGLTDQVLHDALAT